MTQAEYVEALKAASEVKRLEREKTCPQCGTVFVPKKWANLPADMPRFCSNRCTMIYRRARQREAKASAFMCEAAE